ncbi:hypothetical protein U1Q18_022391 [Sarracenia purpurea var. burkii]
MVIQTFYLPRGLSLQVVFSVDSSSSYFRHLSDLVLGLFPEATPAQAPSVPASNANIAGPSRTEFAQRQPILEGRPVPKEQSVLVALSYRNDKHIFGVEALK